MATADAKNRIRDRDLKVVVTGGCGFVGHHFVEHFLKETAWRIVVIDKLTYAGRLDRLRDIDAFDSKRVLVLTADFAEPIERGVLREIADASYVFHLGAESHVDRSIEDPVTFAEANVVGTARLLEVARRLYSTERLQSFYYFSTDEVFGPAPPGVAYRERDRHSPTNPYAASKSGAEMMCRACRHSWRLPVVITRSMNIFGERQHPEKFIPKVIKSVLAGETVPIHAAPDRKTPGSRFYIHARNVADAYLFLVDRGMAVGEFNIKGEREVDNLTLARMVAGIVGKELKYELVDFHSSRPGHDLRYALDDSLLRSHGWSPPRSFEDSLRKTVEWTLAHPQWLET